MARISPDDTDVENRKCIQRLVCFGGDIVGFGWKNIDLAELNYESINERLKEEYKNTEPNHITSIKYIKEMKSGDILLVPYPDDTDYCAIAMVRGVLYFDERFWDLDMANAVPVIWMHKVVKRSDIGIIFTGNHVNTASKLSDDERLKVDEAMKHYYNVI